MTKSGGGEAADGTQRQRDANAVITRTTITPAPGASARPPEQRSIVPPDPAPAKDTKEKSKKKSLRGRGKKSQRHDLVPAQKPYPGAHVARTILAAMLAVLCLVTIGGAVLMLLLWQQDRDSGVLATQADRTWDVFDIIVDVEWIVALAVVPVAMVWIALATINAQRASGRKRNPIISALSLPVGVAGVWIAGTEIVAEADDWVGRSVGIAIQVAFAVIPLIALERVAEIAEAKRRPIRVAFLMVMVYVVHIQLLGGLSTIDRTTDETYGRLGAYLVIAALVQLIAALATNEATRGIDDATEQRYQLRSRFSESLLAQAAR